VAQWNGSPAEARALSEITMVRTCLALCILAAMLAGGCHQSRTTSGKPAKPQGTPPPSASNLPPPPPPGKTPGPGGMR